MRQQSGSVLGVVDAYKSCVLRKDAAALVGLYSEDVRVFDTWGVWSYEGAPAWRQAIDEWFGSLGTDRLSVAFDEVQIFDGGAAAMLSAMVKYTALSVTGIAVRSLHNRLTWGLLRGDGNGGWKIAHEHTSAPIGLGDMKAILRRAALAADGPARPPTSLAERGALHVATDPACVPKVGIAGATT